MKLCMRTEKMFHRKIKSFKLVLLLENRNRQIYSDVYAIMLTIKCDHVSPSQNDDMKSNEKINIMLLYSNSMHLRKIQDQKFSYVLIVLIWSTSRPMNSVLSLLPRTIYTMLYLFALLIQTNFPVLILQISSFLLLLSVSSGGQCQ